MYKKAQMVVLTIYAFVCTAVMLVACVCSPHGVCVPVHTVVVFTLFRMHCRFIYLALIVYHSSSKPHSLSSTSGVG
jgi:hypothetical protein